MVPPKGSPFIYLLTMAVGESILDYPLRTITYKTALVSSSLSSDVAPPDPIPNSEVKRVSADNTCIARFREDRSRLGDSGAVFWCNYSPMNDRHIAVVLECFVNYLYTPCRCSIVST